MAEETNGLERDLAQVAATSSSLRAALADFENVLAAMRAGLQAGRPPLELYVEVDWAGRRDAVFAAQDAFGRAYDQARATAVRRVVDEDGVTLTEVARTVGRSRQFVSRLYRLRD